MLLSVCRAITVKCSVCFLLCKEECSSLFSLQLLRGWIWGALVYVFVGVWDGDYVSQLPYVWYYVVVKSSFKHAREKCEFKRAYVFKVTDV